MNTPVVGIDGCRGQWVVVESDDGTTVSLMPDLTAVVAAVRAGEIAAAAIDMPIGLFDTGPRECDIEARKLLGQRRSTVFPAPARATLPAIDYADACDRSRLATGKALSKQTFNILGPIRQLDRLLEAGDAERIVEAHPELAFARIAGEPLPSKHGPEGRAAREAALRSVLGIEVDALLCQASAAKVPVIDLFDAAVLTITAGRVVAGTEIRVGGAVDPTGKKAQVVY